MSDIRNKNDEKFVSGTGGGGGGGQGDCDTESRKSPMGILSLYIIYEWFIL